MLGIPGSSRRKRHSTWHVAAIRALELDPNLADAHTSLARCSKTTTGIGRWRAPLPTCTRAQTGYDTAHQWYAQLLVTLGRYPEAVWHIEQARRADPVSPAINAYVPYVYLAGRQHERALREARRASAWNPIRHSRTGNSVERICFRTRRAAVAALNPRPRSPRQQQCGTRNSASRTRGLVIRAAAMRLLSALVDRAQHDYVSPYDLAVAFSGIGDRASALDYLEQAVEQRVMRILGVGDPEFDDLRADPRFTRLTARLCLPSAPMTGPASPIVQSRGRWK